MTYWSGEWTPSILLEYIHDRSHTIRALQSERPPYVSAHYRVSGPHTFPRIAEWAGPYISAHYRVSDPIHFRALQSERPPYSLLLCVHHCNARWFAQLLCALQHLRQMVHRCCRAPNLSHEEWSTVFQGLGFSDPRKYCDLCLTHSMHQPRNIWREFFQPHLTAGSGWKSRKNRLRLCQFKCRPRMALAWFVF